jgi:Fe-S-cluster-containing dehydrogenase component
VSWRGTDAFSFIKETDMALNRRALLTLGLAATAGAVPGRVAAGESQAPKDARPSSPNYVGVLVDTTLCIGCRKCEEACSRRNHLPRTAESFADRNAFRSLRRPTESAFTVVNQFPGSPSPDQAGLARTYCKVQCMHCLYPSCVSACIVGALTKSTDGAVVYNPTICIGCRYCQIACPFEVPAYEFHVALAPRVRKCEFCADRAKGTGANPACAASCPTETLIFGRRADLVAMARDRLKRRPDRYVNRIYGEAEVGGTSWLYLTGRPVQEVGLLKLPETPPPQLTEAIQHGIFKYGIIPVAFYGLLAGIMWYNHRTGPDRNSHAGEHRGAPSAHKPEGGGR